MGWPRYGYPRGNKHDTIKSKEKFHGLERVFQVVHSNLEIKGRKGVKLSVYLNV